MRMRRRYNINTFIFLMSGFPAHEAEVYNSYDDIEELELSGGSELDTCLIPSKGKRISSSLTLGYVDIAFPEKIKIEDLRFSF